MDRETVIENLRKYSELVLTVVNPNKIVLFGSYAKGNWNENSDIDVAIFVDNITEDLLQLSTKLCKLTRNIDYRIEPLLLEERNDKSGFITDILMNGIVIYSRSENRLPGNQNNLQKNIIHP